jgi:hypothetical protein
MIRLLAVALGLLTVACPEPWAPAWTYPLAALAALAVPNRKAPVLPVAVATIAAAFSAAPVPVLTAEGLLILAYLLTAAAPPALTRPATWLRRQFPPLIAAAIATAASLAAFAVHPAASPWIALAGIVAVVAAYLAALAPARRPQASMSRDASS